MDSTVAAQQWPRASVVVPAHQEQARIGATLRTLLRTAEDGEFEVVVVVNGSTDATADIARSVSGTTVVELAEPSKIAALREADRRASAFPRIYLDADVPLTTEAARAIADALEKPGCLVAGVPGHVDLSSASLGARLFTGFRSRLPVFKHGIIGAGVYAMSRAGRARFDQWPDILGDDQFVFRLFEPHERCTVEGHSTLVEGPPTLREVVRRGARVRRGNAELTDGAAGRDLAPPPAGLGEALRDALRSPRGWVEAAVFIMVTVVIRVRTRVGGGGDWATSRTA